jgi:hypothetical protein
MLKTSALALALAVSAVAINTSAADAGPRIRHNHGAAVAAGLLGVAVIGATAVAASRSCHVERRSVYNRHGEFVGTRRVRVC